MSKRLPALELTTSSSQWALKSGANFDVLSHTISLKSRDQQKKVMLSDQKRISQSYSTKKNFLSRQINPYKTQSILQNTPLNDESNADISRHICDKNQEIEQLKIIIAQQKQKINELELKLDNLNAEKLRVPDLNINTEVQIEQLEREFKVQLRKIEEQLTSSQISNYQNLEKLANYSNRTKSLQSQTLHMEQQLKCKYCNKMLNEPITIIPCAHTYCKGCQKGYFKKCYICGDDNKIEATYCNEFMISIVNMYQTFEKIIQALTL